VETEQQHFLGHYQGLMVLKEAYDYAIELGRDFWDFAVEIAVLESVGLSVSDLRWLACNGYVEHAGELSVPGEAVRRFTARGGLTFCDRTCFVLTDSGHEFVVQRSLDEVFPWGAAEGTQPLNHNGNGFAVTASVRDPNRHGQQVAKANRHVRNGRRVRHGLTRSELVRPIWDIERRQLRLGTDLIKQFKLPSANQETVLTAFEEDGWPPRIDDPLPPKANLPSKQRLHDTIKSLNRNQQHRLLRFSGDGSGEGVCWSVRSSG